jgi:hypothetical protein
MKNFEETYNMIVSMTRRIGCYNCDYNSRCNRVDDKEFVCCNCKHYDRWAFDKVIIDEMVQEIYEQI